MQTGEMALLPRHIELLAERIEARTGLSFPGARRRDLMIGLRDMAEAAGFERAEQCIEWLLEESWDRSRTELCARCLTNGETYFFREPRAFSLVCEHARKKLADADGAQARLRIWSAGCSTGEEAFSIAMALRQEAPELDPRHIFILGTDIDGRKLEVAQRGIYRQWSFRGKRGTLHSGWFQDAGENRLRVDRSITDMVRFAELNLMDPVYPSPDTGTQEMDIIFCRNVLMYFSQRQARLVIERFRRCLVDGGWLVVSPGEASAELFTGFSARHFPDAIYFQKATEQTDVVTQEPARPPEPIRAVRPTHADNAPPAVRQQHSSALRDATTTPTTGEVAAHARRLASEGKVREAVRYLDHSIEHNPTGVELHHARGLIAMESGNYREALQSLKRMIYLRPDLTIAHFLLGVLFLARNRPREAVRHFEAASEMLEGVRGDEIVPGSDGLPAATLRDSVRAYLDRGRK